MLLVRVRSFRPIHPPRAPFYHVFECLSVRGNRARCFGHAAFLRPGIAAFRATVIIRRLTRGGDSAYPEIHVEEHGSI
jgi:hypothetical protein